MSFVGGKLKLKGGETLKLAGAVTKKKKKKDAERAESPGKDGEGSSGKEVARSEDVKKLLHGYELEEKDENEDRRTEAEKRFAARQIKLEEDRLKKLAAKSHRDRVKDFNDYLANLSVRGLHGTWCACATGRVLEAERNIQHSLHVHGSHPASTPAVHICGRQQCFAPAYSTSCDKVRTKQQHTVCFAVAQEHHDIPRVGPG